MKPKPFSELNHFTVPCVAMLFVFLGCHPVEPVSAAGKAGHVFSVHSVALKGAKRTGISLGRTESPGHCPQGGSDEREGRTGVVARAATWRPKLTSSVYPTPAHWQIMAGGGGGGGGGANGCRALARPAGGGRADGRLLP